MESFEGSKDEKLEEVVEQTIASGKKLRLRVAKPSRLNMVICKSKY